MFPVAIAPEVEGELPLLDREYLEDLLQIALYLLTLQRPNSMPVAKFYCFKQRALKYLVRHCRLYRRALGNNLLRAVINSLADWQRIIDALH